VRDRRVDGERHRDEREADLAGEEQPAAVDGVGDGAADDRRDEERDERGQVKQPDRKRGVRQLEKLVGNGDPGDLAGEKRDPLSEEQAPERR
jgi:hypothetical protein